MHAVERAIAKIAGRQDNVITRDQLLSAGLGRGAIAHRIKARTMQRLHTNVYLLGAAPPTPMARARAAVLSYGTDAVVSHRSAACLYGLLQDTGGDVDVTVPGRCPRQKAGIRRHRAAGFRPQDIRTMRGLSVTSVARTICDLAATESARDTEHAFQEALYRDIVTDKALQAILAREPTRKGSPLIKALIDNPTLTRSDRERRLLKLIRDAQLPTPRTNVRVHGYLVDVFWPEHGLTLEFDGWQAHGHRLAFEKNRRRDQVLLAAGIRVLRITDRQLTNEPIALVARIAQALRTPI
jgi:very-short-patch-repair endonuclease